MKKVKVKPNSKSNAKLNAKPAAKMLTDVELELMTILWRCGEGSVSDVMAGLPVDRNLAYTSVSTILRILEQKEVLETRKIGRGHIYIPRIKKSDYEGRALRHVVDRVFDGAPIALVRQLLDAGSLDERAIEELEALLSQAREKK